MPVGGGFGGKFGLIEPLVAACAVAAGRPVRLAYTRIEDFSSASPAPSSIFRVKAGARKDGTFTALKAEVIFDAGAKPGAPAAHAALCLAVFYRWQNLDIDATEVVTHKTPTGAYRAPGLPQAMFASREPGRRAGREARAWTRSSCARRTPRGRATFEPDGTPWPQIGLPSASSAPSRSIAPSWPRRARTKASAWRWAAGSAAPSRRRRCADSSRTAR